jgi:hypothetical protein
MSANLEAIGSIAVARLRASKSTLGMPRGMLLVLVVTALGFLSLRPFCDLAFAGTNGDHAHAVAAAALGIHQDRDGGDTPSGTCCAGIKDGTLVKPAEPLISWTPGGTLGATLFAFAGLLPFARSRNPARTSLAVSPGRSYYARSARILR